MGRYAARRILQIIPVFFGTTFLIFAMVWALPGDPIRALSGDKPPPPAVYEQLRQEYNLDDPLIIQYLKYMAGLFQGDFGTSFRGQEVADIMAQAWPVTLKLALTAFFFEIVIGLTAGIMAGLRKGRFIDNLVLISTTLVVSIPIFVLGFTAQLVFGVKLGWFPIAGVQNGWPTDYILPGLVLASVALAYLARLTRTSLVENLRSDYVRTAIAKGLPRRRVVGRHTLRNSLIPVVTLLGVDLGSAHERRHRHRGHLQPARNRAGDLPRGGQPGGHDRRRHFDSAGAHLLVRQPDRGHSLRFSRSEDPL